jgi:putative membrane protein
MLHPLSPVVNLVPRFWATLRASWALLVAIWFGTGGRIVWLDLLLICSPFMMAAAGSVIHWATLRYRVANGRLELETGLVRRQTRVIALRRIQHVRRIRRLLHRATGLSEVEVETASGTEIEGLLSALSSEDADALLALLSPRGESAQTEEETVRYASDLSDLFLYGATGTRWGAIFLVWGVVGELAQWQNPDRISRITRALGPVGAVAALVALITGTWLAGIAVAITRHWGFTLVERGGVLVANDGLLTARRVEVHPGKVQAAAVLEPLFRRITGFGTVVVETAAARAAASGTERAQATLPAVDQHEAGALLAGFVPGAPADLATLALEPAAAASLGVARIRALIGSSILACLAIAVFGRWGAPVLSLVPLLVFRAGMENAALGYAVMPDTVVSRSGWIRRETWVIARRKIQSVLVSADPLLRMRDLARVSVRVAGRRVVLPAVSRAQAVAIASDLAHIPAFGAAGDPLPAIGEQQEPASAARRESSRRFVK